MPAEMPSNPLARDLEEVVASVGEAWEQLRGARLFVTGGTGFVGTWLLESLVWANRTLGLGAEMVVLTRDAGRFADKALHLASEPSISLLHGDVVDFEPPAGPFTHVIHAAAESSTRQNEIDPLRMIDTVSTGTRNVLEAARAWGGPRVLFVSSGAVYGPQPEDMPLIAEDYLGGPNQLAPGSAYAESKRFAELLCATYAAQHGVPVAAARCFAFVGPYLSLDAHFAIGNFIGNGIAGEPIVVKGDGTPVRSYMYASDLAAWLLTILARGDAGRAYNVGSEDGRTIAEIANAVATVFEPTPKVSIEALDGANSGGAGNRYVPSTARARGELGLSEMVGLTEAVRRTVEWRRGRSDGSGSDSAELGDRRTDVS